MPKWIFVFFGFFALFAVAGSSALATANPNTDPTEVAEELLNRGFSYDSRLVGHFGFDDPPCEMNNVYLLSKDPVTQHQRTISLHVYRNPDRKTSQSVLIVPPIGGSNLLDESFGIDFCRFGIESWVIVEWDKGLVDLPLTTALESQDDAARKAVSAIRQIVKRMSGKIGILGTSAGGLSGAVALAVEPAIRTGFFVVAGAGMAEILAESNVSTIADIREKRMRKFGWDISEYKNQVRDRVHIDPLYFGSRLKRKRVGAVVALEDESVPSAQQVLFEKVSGAERIAEFKTGHIETIITNGLLNRYSVIEYFLEHP
ncbi:MAG: hypothetical protein C5B49_13465 [Bdellovibrio sp.]|nr:MAG: hypothetical protein C5B49_13465 [Bdellovibrio sp.]